MKGYEYQKGQYVIIGKVSFSGRENIVSVRAAGDGETSGMMAYTLRSANELRSSQEYFRDIKPAEVNEESLELAESLIAKRSSKLDLSKFEDGYEVAGQGIGRSQTEAPARAKG